MLPPGVREQASALGTADIVVGLPSYNNAGTIGAVLDAVRAGLQKHFDGARAVLVCSDGGSTDETRAQVDGVDWDAPRILARHESPPEERVAVPYHGVPGRGAAHRTILEVAHLLGARACILVGADRRSIVPEWIDRVLRPILEDDHDYVAPLYQRHRYEGTLTSGLVSPLVGALYGRRIRQPLAGEAGLSGRLVAHLRGTEGWASDLVRHGITLWALATAVTEQFSVCEAWLGPSVVDARDRRAELEATLSHVMDSVFALQAQTAEAWRAVRGSQPVPVLGRRLPLGLGPVELNVTGMIRAFRLGLKDLLPVWEQILAPDTLADVLALGFTTDEGHAFPHALWARVVYDFAVGYRVPVLYRQHLLRSLVPLYLGRTAAFIRETASGGAREAEAWIDAGARAFEREKAYLLERWP
jgi:glucosylglycerate synthase